MSRTPAGLIWSVVTLGTAVLPSFSCRSGPREPQAFVFQGETMGTTYTVKVVAEVLTEERRESLDQLIDRELEEINAKMSHYRENSELSRFNRSSDLSPFPLSEDTFVVFRHAIDVSVRSGGAFDITVGPLVNAWGFGPGNRRGDPPTHGEIAGILERIGHQKLELDPVARTVRKTVPDLYCDLSAIAPGYAVDKIAEALEEADYPNHMVELGGEVRTKGLNPSGLPWRIGVEKPITGERVIERVVLLSGWSMSTSGNYRNYYDVNGARISHTIDPRTGRPAVHPLGSVSVIHELCVLADAWATALMVLGPDEAYALAVEQDLAVLFLVPNEQGGFRQVTTPAFDRLFQSSDSGRLSSTGKVTLVSTFSSSC